MPDSDPDLDANGDELSDPSPSEAPTRTEQPYQPAGGRTASSGPRLKRGQGFGEYHIERLLGRGGMGEVYEATETKSGRRVAIKLLGQSLDEGDRARFLREGRLAASVNHPNAVYIFGAAEIWGVPVITMELAPGGTLKDRVKAQGPLPSGDAVDAILQVVAGLDAAARAGVLHRDIKPSNCFVGHDDEVKIGDFGLSISTLGGDEPALTQSGSFMGTPAFASPEQLRVQPLDVRSDIYSVGATLYYLLTGHAPFEDADIIKLTTMVVQDDPVPPPELQPGVPEGLSELVLRCLAKRPEERFADYAALATALEPYTTTAPVPATLGLRLAAGVLDFILLATLYVPIVFLFGFLPSSAAFASTGPADVLRALLGGALTAGYFGLLEWHWGQSLGKAICGLQVVMLGGQALDLKRAAARALFFAGCIQIVNQIPGLAFGNPFLFSSERPLMAVLFGFVRAMMPLVGATLLAAAARRRNGFATLHDMVTGTRVVKRSPVEARTGTGPSVPTPPPPGADRIGPYVVAPDSANGPVTVAYDDRLRRRVWLRRCPPDTPAVPALRRDLSRPGRVRWLAGQRGGHEGWDAYEAPDGEPLTLRLQGAQPWSVVRHWVADLASELKAALTERAVPHLAVDRVWIGADGRARLLDWPMGHGETDAGRPRWQPLDQTEPADLATLQRFLWQVALSALGRLDDDGRAQWCHPTHPTPLPIPARSFLDRLEHGSFPTVHDVEAGAKGLAGMPSGVSRRRRLAHLAICASVPATTAVAVVVFAVAMGIGVQQDREAFGLVSAARVLEWLDDQVSSGRADPGRATQRRALEVHIANRYRDRLTSGAPIPRPAQVAIGTAWDAVERALAAHPDPAPAEVAQANAVVSAELPGAMEPAFVDFMSPGNPVQIAPRVMSALAVAGSVFGLLTAVAGVVSAALARGGIFLRLLGMGVVTADGVVASRALAFRRALVAWAPVLLMGGAMLGDMMVVPDDIPPGISLVLLSTGWTVFLVGGIWGLRSPQRGPHDRLVGTYLVLR